MATRLADLLSMSDALHKHMTRKEAAIHLCLTTRQVDRLARAGKLQKLKLSSRRRGFDRAELDRYLEDANFPKKFGGPTEEYASRISLLVIDIPPDVQHDINQLARRLDELLCHRLPGCWLKVTGRPIYVMSNSALEYTPDQILSVV